MALLIGIDGRYLNDHYPGIGRYVFNLLKALPYVADNDENIQVLVDTGAVNSRFQLDELDNIKLIKTNVPRRRLQEQIGLRQHTKQLGWTLFHAPYFITTYRSSCPLVVTVHDTIPAHYPQSLSQRLAFRLAMYTATRTARFILTPSHTARQDLIGLFGVSPNRIVVTPEAADQRFQPANIARIDALRTRLGLHCRYVLYLGINKPHKNLLRLIEAWRMLRTYGINSHHLVIAGYWDLRYPEAQQRAQKLGLEDVHILGPIAESDLPVLYSGADLFVFPSLYEGFGLPVLEAMACGTPVTCSARSSLLEIAGKAAAFFDPVKTESITSTLAGLLRDPQYRAHLTQLGLEQARKFSWQQTARLTLDVYRQAANRV